jgi:hypothetical protein
VDTGDERGATVDVAVALSAVGVERAQVTFGLGTGEGAVAQEPHTAQGPSGPIQLSASRTLKDALDRLVVYRTQTAGFGRVPARFETTPRPAAIMHESAPAGEGGLEARWQLGPLPWDAVGLTRQRSGGEARSGLWAHPRKGTTLVIETEETGGGRVLEGFHGLTDFSVEQVKGLPPAGPIRFRVFVDGQPVLAREVPRARGWTSFAAGLPETSAPSRPLRVEIDAPADSWAHFVFDLWTR